MPESPFPLRLSAIFLRYWSDPRAESYAESIVAPFCDLPGVRRVGPRFLAVLPIPGDPGEVTTAVRLAERMIADYRLHLSSRRREERGTGLGVLVVPGWARLAGRKASREPEPLLDALELHPPKLPRDRVYLTGYAAARAEGLLNLLPAAPYEAASGARATLFERGEMRPDARPWHNTRLLRRTLAYLPRPEVEQALREHAASPLLRVAGPLGCGKTRAVWQALGPEGIGPDAICVWVSVPVRRAEEGLAPRLLRQMARVIGSDSADVTRTSCARWLLGEASRAERTMPEDLPGLVNPAVAAATEACGVPFRLVFDDLQAAAAMDLDILAALLVGPAPLAGARVVLVGRSRAGFATTPDTSDTSGFAGLPACPEVRVPPMSAVGITALAETLTAGLDMPPEVRQRFAEAASGFPLALEEDLARRIQSRQLRSHYGNFFFGGAKSADAEPSLRLVQLLEAEASALGNPLPLRLLAVAGVAVPAREIAAAVFSLGGQLPAGWEEPFLASGWLHRTRSPWGLGVDLVAASYARVFAHTVPEEAALTLRRALGEILAEVSGEPAALWHAYRLLSGSAEAVSPILELARDQPAAVPPRRILTGLAAELAAHRERGGEAARELQILWILLPLARRLGQLAEFESDLLRALEIAGDEPRKLLALASLKADFDLTLGRFVAGEKTVRGVLGRVLTADAGRQSLLLLQLGRLLARQGRRREARGLFERLLAAAEEQERLPLAATCRFHLGNLALFDQRLAAAEALHREALAARREEANPRTVAASLCALAAVAQACGRYPEALATLAEAQGVLGKDGDEAEESFVLLGLGRAHAELGDRLAAARHLRRSLLLREGRPDRLGEAVVRLALAANHLDLQQTEKAAEEARLAHFHLSLAPEGALLGDAEQLLGRIELFRQRYLPASVHFAAALEIHQRHGDTAAVLLDRGWQLELSLAREDGREVRRLVRELTGKSEEVPAGSRAALAFRLSRGLDWLHARGLQLGDPTPLLERAYSAVLTIAGTLAPELRHRYLFEISDHAAILAAASARHLVA
jgi:tetratricopeptide (TPR) repeat protein